MTDHGISYDAASTFYTKACMCRSSFPASASPREVGDLVEHIDLAAISPVAAGIPCRPTCKGLRWTRPHKVSGPRRGSPHVDHIRSVRSHRFKYPQFSRNAPTCSLRPQGCQGDPRYPPRYAQGRPTRPGLFTQRAPQRSCTTLPTIPTKSTTWPTKRLSIQPLSRCGKP